MMSRWQLYGVLAVTFVLGVLGIRARLLAEGEARLRSKIATKRMEAIKKAQGVENEIDALDRDTLKRRATVWVRKSKR
jgi:hypothetical protein